MAEMKLRREKSSTLQTKEILAEMLEFLSSSSEEEDDSLVDDYTTTDDNISEISSTLSLPDYRSYVVDQLERIEEEYPIRDIQQGCELESNVENLQNGDPTGQQKREREHMQQGNKQFVHKVPLLETPGRSYMQDAAAELNSKLESNCRQNNRNTYVQEVRRAIYSSTDEQPLEGSESYYEAAQNYAIYGKDFFDFPQNLSPLINDRSSELTPTENLPLALTKYASPSCSNSSSGAMGVANFGGQAVANTLTAAGTMASYYQTGNSMPSSHIRASSTTATYGMYLGHNKITYFGPHTGSTIFYSQQQQQQQPQISSASATSYITNTLTNANFATPALMYSSPIMTTTTTQQYLNTFMKETQYLTCGSTPQGTTTSVYERWFYAQMMQQQFNYQQAAAVAAIFQHKVATAAVRQPPRSNVATASVTVVPVQVSNHNACVRSPLTSGSCELIERQPISIPPTSSVTIVYHPAIAGEYINE